MLVLVGLSLVIGMFGAGSPMTLLVSSEGLRQLITGFLFGTTGASIALSVVGKERERSASSPAALETGLPHKAPHPPVKRVVGK